MLSCYSWSLFPLYFNNVFYSCIILFLYLLFCWLLILFNILMHVFLFLYFVGSKSSDFFPLSLFAASILLFLTIHFFSLTIFASSICIYVCILIDNDDGCGNNYWKMNMTHCWCHLWITLYFTHSKNIFLGRRNTKKRVDITIEWHVYYLQLTIHAFFFLHIIQIISIPLSFILFLSFTHCCIFFFGVAEYKN